jgi:PHS family inorganic phosphate transporter-like MFS transporter
LGDQFGRSTVYGKELILIIVATIICISVPSYFSGDQVLTWIFITRIILGIGIGGDYPMSATVVSDRANVHRRGTLLCFIFANQGWGSFVGSLATLVVLGGFKHDVKNGHPKYIDRAWRLLIGLSLIPAFATLYARLTLPESTKYKLTKEDSDSHLESTSDKDLDKDLEKHHAKVVEGEDDSPKVGPVKDVKARHGVVVAKRQVATEFIAYFSEWKHLKNLLGTTLGWFLVDIAFYGINVCYFPSSSFSSFLWTKY